MILVVHFPKTAGTTVKSLVADAFGERLLLVYGERPLARAPIARKAAAAWSWLRPHPELAGYDCVYGHYLPLMYARVPGARFATWLRDPVQRAMSRYHHYRRASEAGRSPMPPGLDPARFLSLPAMRDTYAKYLWRFPLERFEFVGITEELDRSLALFRNRFSIAGSGAAPRLNANPERQSAGYDVDPALRRLILALNARDVHLYEQARRRFEADARASE